MVDLLPSLMNEDMDLQATMQCTLTCSVAASKFDTFRWFGHVALEWPSYVTRAWQNVPVHVVNGIEGRCGI